MTKFLSDIVLEQATDIQFKTTAGVNAGKIEQDGNDLVLTNAVGDILLGDGSSDVYIGDGTNSVDIIFEQSGAIKGDGSSVTLTLGGSGTTLNLENPNINGSVSLGVTNISNILTLAGSSSKIVFDYEAAQTGEYTNEVPLLQVDRNGSPISILSRVSSGGAVVLGADDMVHIAAGDTKNVVKANLNMTAENVVLSSEAGFTAYGFPANGTTWANRNEFRFRSDSGTASENGLYIGDGGNTQFIDLSRNLTVGTGEFEGNVIINTPSSNGAGQGLTINRPAAGTHYASVEFATNGTVDWSVGTNSSDAFEIYENGAASTTRFSIAEGGDATFAGTVKAATTFIADAVDGTNNDPGTDNVRLSGYGMIGNRDQLYITNVGNKLVFGVGGTHNAQNKLIISGSTSNFYNNIASTGTITGTTLTGTSLDINGNADISGSTTSGAITASSSSSAQLQVSGWSNSNGANNANGTIYIGNTTAYRGIIDYDAASTGSLIISNTWNNNAGNIVFKTKTAGTDVIPLTLHGDGGATFAGAINASGGLYYVGDTHMGFVPYPKGAQYRSDSSTDTGYILIKLPTDIGNSPDDMVSFYVDIYDYTTNEMISVFIGGYTYRTSSTATYWYNCTAIINTKLAAKDFVVRFGNDGTNYYVAIGETNSVWSHPSIVVRDFQCSYRGNVEHYVDGWAISTETGTLSGVDETQTGNLPVASNVTGVVASANLDSDTMHLSVAQTISNHKSFGDQVYLRFGAGSDMGIYHDGTDNHIDSALPLNIATDTSGAGITIGHTTSEVLIADNLTINGNLTTKGDVIIENTTNLAIRDTIITLNDGTSGTSGTDSSDIGIMMQRHGTNKFFGYDESEDEFIMVESTADVTGAVSGVQMGTTQTLAANIRAYDSIKIGTSANEAASVYPASTTTSLGTSNTLVPTQNAVKSYVDAKTWNGNDITAGTVVSARLDADTAHLSETQTFTGAKTFSNATSIGSTLASNEYSVVTIQGRKSHMFSFSGQSDHTLTLNSSSYYQAEVTITAHQTNGGTYNNIFIRGIWSNNHTSHHWDELERVGSMTGNTITITNGQNGSTAASGQLAIVHDNVQGDSFGLFTVNVIEHFGSSTHVIS